LLATSGCERVATWTQTPRGAPAAEPVRAAEPPLAAERGDAPSERVARGAVRAPERRPPADAPARELEGQVVAVHDGDTLSLRADGRRLRVRLAQIDAPERGQPWGRRARQALARLADGRAARAVVVDRDDYGRAVADVFVGELFVNLVLVREGNAWAHPRYVRSEAVLAAQAQARRERRGLWRLPVAEQMPPWEWRRAHPRREPGSPRAAAPERAPAAGR
jgi:endonuclease YncB( thermonuclease family)